MDSIKPIEAYLLSKKHETKVQENHHPSSARIVEQGKVVCGVGGCLRAQYYSWKGVKPSNPIDLNGLHNITTGHRYEYWYEEGLKLLEIEYKAEVPFKVDIGLKNKMSGRIDFIVKQGDNWEGVELKTSYGRGMDWYKKTNAPKEDYYLQMQCYFKCPDYAIKVFNNPIFARDNFYRRSFVVEPDPTVFNKIVASWKELEGYLEKGDLPPKDFHKSKDRRGVMKDDFHCRYCSYRDHCKKEVTK